MDMSLSKLQEMVKDRDTSHAAVQGGHKESDTTEWLNKLSGPQRLDIWSNIILGASVRVFLLRLRLTSVDFKQSSVC